MGGNKMNIGLIGAGSIGTFLIEQLNKEHALAGHRVTALFDERDKPNKRLTQLSEDSNITIYKDLSSFLNSPIDLVVECANIEVIEKYAVEILCHRDLLLISAGALADHSVYKDLKATAQHYNRNVYVPTGAIGALDVLSAANVLNGLTSVTLVTRKPSHAFSSASSSKETIMFEGPAGEAIKNFPKNANIAITLSLTGIGVENTKVKIIADPTVTQNIHTLEATGDFGELEVTLKNNPSPNNPKTSYLTALSILSTIRSLKQAIIIK